MKTDISRTRLKERMSRKTNSDISETIKLAMETPAWKEVAKILSGPTRAYSSVNLSRIEDESKEGDTLLVIGKVLSSGDLTKKVRIVSLSISGAAMEKLKKTKSEYASIAEEIKINSKFEGVKILR